MTAKVHASQANQGDQSPSVPVWAEVRRLLQSMQQSIAGLRDKRNGGLTEPQVRLLAALEQACDAALVCLRLRQDERAGVVTHGSLSMDSVLRTATLDGQEIMLTRTEFDLLWCLLVNAGHIVRYDQLAGQVWGIAGDGSSLIKQHLSRLKLKVGRVHDRRWPVRAVRGVGYILE